MCLSKMDETHPMSAGEDILIDKITWKPITA